jgi:hypothetical protein
MRYYVEHFDWHSVTQVQTWEEADGLDVLRRPARFVLVEAHAFDHSAPPRSPTRGPGEKVLVLVRAWFDHDGFVVARGERMSDVAALALADKVDSRKELREVAAERAKRSEADAGAPGATADNPSTQEEA